jgi:DNA-binding protein H-NS
MSTEKRNLEEMIEAQKQLAKDIKLAQSQALRDIKTRLVAELKAKGFTVDELFKIMMPKSASQTTPKTKAAPKFQHPEDAEKTWSGRGKKPKWVTEYVDGGGKLESLLIEKSEDKKEDKSK